MAIQYYKLKTGKTYQLDKATGIAKSISSIPTGGATISWGGKNLPSELQAGLPKATPTKTPTPTPTYKAPTPTYRQPTYAPPTETPEQRTEKKRQETVKYQAIQVAQRGSEQINRYYYDLSEADKALVKPFFGSELQAGYKPSTGKSQFTQVSAGGVQRQATALSPDQIKEYYATEGKKARPLSPMDWLAKQTTAEQPFKVDVPDTFPTKTIEGMMKTPTTTQEMAEKIGASEDMATREFSKIGLTPEQYETVQQAQKSLQTLQKLKEQGVSGELPEGTDIDELLTKTINEAGYDTPIISGLDTATTPVDKIIDMYSTFLESKLLLQDKKREAEKALREMETGELQRRVDIEGQPIPMSFIGGQLNKLREYVSYQMLPLQNEISNLTAELGIESEAITNAISYAKLIKDMEDETTYRTVSGVGLVAIRGDEVKIIAPEFTDPSEALLQDIKIQKELLGIQKLEKGLEDDDDDDLTVGEKIPTFDEFVDEILQTPQGEEIINNYQEQVRQTLMPDMRRQVVANEVKDLYDKAIEATTPKPKGEKFSSTEKKKLEQAGLSKATRQEQLDFLYGKKESEFSFDDL